MRTGIAETGVVFATRMVGVLAGIATQICLAWLLAPAGRGEFAVCTTFAVVLGVVFGLGFDRAIQYQLISGAMSRSEAVGFAIASTAGNCAIAALAGWLAVELPFAFFQKASLESFRLSLLLMPAVALQTALSLLLDGERRFRAGAWVAVVNALGNLALTVLLAGVYDLGVAGAIVAWVLSSACAVGVQLWYLRARPALPALDVQRRILSYASRYYLARLGNAINVEIGMIVLAWLAQTAEVGLFSAASVLTGRIILLPQTLSTVVLPRVGQSADGRPDLVAQSSRMSSLFLAAGLSVLVVASPVVVPLALSPAFAPAVPLVWALAIGTWAKGVALPVSAYFVGIGRPGIVSGLTGLELVCNALLIPYCYSLFGLIGAAVGASLAYLISNVVRVELFKRLASSPGLRVWLPSLGDLRYVVSLLDRLFGLPVPHRRTFLSAEAAAAAPPCERYVVFMDDRVVKRQPPERTRLEALKTRQGAEAGLRSGLYRVPEMLAEPTPDGVLAFRRVPRALTLWSFLRETRDATERSRLVRRAARALAVIHSGLSLPKDLRVGMSEHWILGSSSAHVTLHGDFTAHNLLVTDGGSTLWITDWATSDKLDPDATLGPPEVDVAWFIASLFFSSHLGLRRVVDRGELASAFIQEYCRSGQLEERAMAEYLSLIARRLREMRPPLYERLRRVTQEQLAGRALLRFSRRNLARVAGTIPGRLHPN